MLPHSILPDVLDLGPSGPVTCIWFFRRSMLRYPELGLLCEFFSGAALRLFV